MASTYRQLPSPADCTLVLIDFQPAMYQGVQSHDRAMQRLVQAGAVPITALQFVFEMPQDWARTGTYGRMKDILKNLTSYGTQVRFSKWALGGHASEAGRA